MPNKHARRHRQFSIVVHDIKPEAKSHFEKVIDVLEPDWSLIAEEEYNHQEGSHLHIFIKYSEPRSFKNVLKFCQDQEMGGRIQVDVGRGNFVQCRKYITDPDKFKKLDDNISENVRKLTLVERYHKDVSLCETCNKHFYNPPPFRCLPDIYRARKCFKCSDITKDFKEYLKKLSQDNIP